MLLNAEIKYIEKFDLNPFISIVLWRPICYVCVIQYKFNQYRFNCQFIIIWDFSSSWGISALNFAAQLCTAKMLDEEWSLNGSSRTAGNAQWSSPATPTAHSRCQNISEWLSSVFLIFLVVAVVVGWGAAETVLLCLDRGNHSIFAEQASTRKLSYVLFWH